MPFFSKEEIRRAREMDLLTYLSYYDPGNLKRVSGNVYSTVEHDSLIISNGKWCWFSRQIGGTNALEYLIKVKQIPFLEAVEKLIGQPSEPIPQYKPPTGPPKKFCMPELNSDTTRAYTYLVNRGIDPEIIQWCIDHKLIFETKEYGNVLFIGYDKTGTPRHGSVRSTFSTYKGDVKGSDKRFAFRMVRADSPRKVHVFEAVPDLLSYATCVKLSGENWRKESYLSLGGIGGRKLPRALEQFLIDYPDISHIYLHLDNDEPGREATKNIQPILKDKTEKMYVLMFRAAGITIFVGDIDPVWVVIPVVLINICFFVFSFLCSVTIKRVDVKELITE